MPAYGVRLIGLVLVAACSLAGPVAAAAPPPEVASPPASAPAQAGASPQVRTRASEPYARAVALMQTGEFSAAIPLLEATLRLGDFKNAVWNLAVCYRTMGRLSEAATTLERFLGHPRASTDERSQARSSLEAIRRLLGRLTLRTRPAGARITLDGRELGLTPLEVAVDPGQHRLEISAAGFVSSRTEVSLAASESRVIDLALVLQPATLAVRSDPPGAAVLVGGRQLGRTPLEARLTPGSHELVLRVPGRRPAHRRIVADPGERVALEVPLVPLEASLLVSVDRPGARVLLDGRTVGQTPLRPQRLPPGRHLLAVRAPGYDPWTRTLGLEDRQVVTATIKLRRGRLHPAWFAAIAAAAVALASVGGGLYAESVNAGASYSTDKTLLSTQQPPPVVREARPRAEAAFARSNRFYAASTGLFITSGVLAGAASVLAAFTRFGRSQGTVEVAPGAADLSPGGPEPMGTVTTIRRGEKPASSRATALVALAVLGTLASSGCRPTDDKRALTGLGCIIPLVRTACAPVATDFRLDGCVLYGGPQTREPGLAHGQGWSRRTDALDDPCGEAGVGLDLRGAATDPRQAGTLVCNLDGGACPDISAPPAGTRMICDLSRPVAVLGQGVTAASMSSDGKQLWAGFGADYGVKGFELKLAGAGEHLGDRSLVVPNATTDSNRGPCNEVSFWSRPLGTADGARLLAGCAAFTIHDQSIDQRTHSRLALYSFDRRAAVAETVCEDVGQQVSGVDLGGAPSSAWAALTLDCGVRSESEGACLADGPLVLPLDDTSEVCDSGRRPAATVRDGERAAWVDVFWPGAAAIQRVDGAGRSEISVTIPGLAGDLAAVPETRTQFRLTEPEGNPPVLAERDGSVVIGVADPVAGPLATRLDVSTLSPDRVGEAPVASFHHRLARFVPGFEAPIAGDAGRPVQWSALAIAEGGRTYAMCYTAGLNNSDGLRVRSLRAALHRDGDGDTIRPTFCLAGWDSVLPCAITSPEVAKSPQETCAVAPLEGPASVPGASFIYLVPSAGLRSLHLVAPPDDYEIDERHPIALPLYSSEVLGDFGEVTDLQLALPDRSSDYLALVGDRSGAYTAYGLDPSPDGPTEARVLWRITPPAGSSRPRLRSRTGAVWVSYREPRGPGSSVLRRFQIHPEMHSEEVLLPAGTDAVGLSTERLVHAGPYANDTAAPDADAPDGNAWLDGVRFNPNEGPSRLRLIPRRERGARWPVLVQGDTVDAAGRWQAIAAFAPDGTAASAGPFVTRVSSDLTFRPLASPLGPARRVDALAAARVDDAADRVLVLYLDVEAGQGSGSAYLAGVAVDPAVTLAATPLDGAGTALRTSFQTGAELDDGAAPFVPGGGAELVTLAPGVLGVSFCAERNGQLERRLQPIDLLGTSLGPAVELGVQVTRSQRRLGALDCPPATLVRHGPSLLSSSVLDGQVVLREVSCQEK